MKIVFFGSSDFSVSSLERIAASEHILQAVVTQPDRKKGRRLSLQATPVKIAASSKNIPVHQPESLEDAAFLKSLKSLSTDIFIVVAYGGILPRKALGIPKIYSINLHPSLLPKYRGAAPVNWAIVRGETKTGLTVIRMNEKMDAGDIILQRKVEIENKDTSETLNARLAELGGILLLDALRFIKEERIKFKKQDGKKATLAPRLKKEDGLIDWGKDARDIHNMVRGLVPWPCAYTFLDGKLLKIWKTEKITLSAKAPPGTAVEVQKDFLTVACGKNALVVKEVQIAGKKRMKTADFLRGHSVEKGKSLVKEG